MSADERTETMNDDEFRWNTQAARAQTQFLEILNGDDALPFEDASDEDQWIDSALDAIAMHAAYHAAILTIHREPYEKVKTQDVLSIIENAVEIAGETYKEYNPLIDCDRDDLAEHVTRAATCAAFMAAQRARAAYQNAHESD